MGPLSFLPRPLIFVMPLLRLHSPQGCPLFQGNFVAFACSNMATNLIPPFCPLFACYIGTQTTFHFAEISFPSPLRLCDPREMVFFWPPLKEFSGPNLHPLRVAVFLVVFFFGPLVRPAKDCSAVEAELPGSFPQILYEGASPVFIRTPIFRFCCPSPHFTLKFRRMDSIRGPFSAFQARM